VDDRVDTQPRGGYLGAPNRPLPQSDSFQDARDAVEPVPTSRDKDMPARPGWSGPTYYGRSQLKAAPFDPWVVGGYIFLAGLSGSAAVLSNLAELVRGPKAGDVGRRGRYLSMLAPTLGSLLLILDLHTPQRFYNMFRIAKRTSPMSIGTWILSSFIPFAGLGFLSQLGADVFKLKGLRALARIGFAPAAMSGAGLSTYTASLLSATSTPYWAAQPKELAMRFAASSVASGAAALALGAKSDANRRTLETIGAAALVVELAATVMSHKTVKAKGVGESLNSDWGRAEEVMGLGVGILLPLGVYAATRLRGRQATAANDLAALATLVGSAMLRVSTLAIGDDSASRPEVSLRFSQPENLPPPRAPKSVSRRGNQSPP
jgi:formate-dependent nitrite reductase membrane component NrfD